MPKTVKANARTIVHKTSGDIHTVFPDVCLTPPIPLPIPYPNVGTSAPTSGGALTVTADGAMPMVKSATYPTTSGDEAGVKGGVISGSNMKEAEFLMYSFDVKFEGRNVCRVGDPMWHNSKNIAG